MALEFVPDVGGRWTVGILSRDSPLYREFASRVHTRPSAVLRHVLQRVGPYLSSRIREGIVKQLSRVLSDVAHVRHVGHRASCHQIRYRSLLIDVRRGREIEVSRRGEIESRIVRVRGLQFGVVGSCWRRAGSVANRWRAAKRSSFHGQKF